MTEDFSAPEHDPACATNGEGADEDPNQCGDQTQIMLGMTILVVTCGVVGDHDDRGHTTCFVTGDDVHVSFDWPLGRRAHLN